MPFGVRFFCILIFSIIYHYQTDNLIKSQKKNLFGKHEIFTHSGQKKSKQNLISFIEEIQNLGVGEIVINSISNDGKMQGLDFDLLDKVLPSIHCQLTIMGGAGSYEDIEKLFTKYYHVSFAAGSLFVFKGKYRAVLISYPSTEVKKALSSIKLSKI